MCFVQPLHHCRVSMVEKHASACIQHGDAGHVLGAAATQASHSARSLIWYTPKPCSGIWMPLFSVVVCMLLFLSRCYLLLATCPLAAGKICNKVVSSTCDSITALPSIAMAIGRSPRVRCRAPRYCGERPDHRRCGNAGLKSPLLISYLPRCELVSGFVPGWRLSGRHALADEAGNGRLRP